MAEGDHDWEERLYEDFLYVVDVECLERAGSRGEDRSCRVRRFEVFGDRVGVGEDLGSGGVLCGINDYRKSVYGATIISNGTRRGTQ